MPGMEPRMRPRPPGPFFSAHDMTNMLYAYGDDPSPLPETVRLLDEIIVDFVIELCYEAEMHAAHANRVKIKADDFQFAIRHKGRMLGRTQDMFVQNKEIKEVRQTMDLQDGKVLKDQADKEGAKPGRGKRRKVQTNGDGRGADGDGPANADITADLDASSDRAGSEHSVKIESGSRSISGVKRGAGAAGLD